ncbi:MAG: hypothetical protein ACXVC1_05360 [Tumebacillaceae bacterium]
MFPLPHRFDLNEWSVMIASVVLVGLVIVLPKRFPGYFTFLNLIFTIFLVMSVDDVLALKPYDMYDWMDDEKFELFDVFTYFFMYPPMGYLFLYFYDKWKLRSWRLLVYIYSWALFSIGFEWMCIKLHILVYKGWSLVYSVPVYLAVFGIELGFFHLVQKYKPSPS